MTDPSSNYSTNFSKNTKKDSAFLDIRGLSDKMTGLYQESTTLFEQLVSERNHLHGDAEY